MANPNIAAIAADAWDQIATLALYDTRPLPIGYWRGKAFVKLWDWRSGTAGWRRLPSKDVPEGSEPSAASSSVFESRWLYEMLH